MNIIFTLIITISTIIITIFSPQNYLEITMGAVNKSIALSINLIAIYTIWSGVLKVAEDSGILQKFSKLLKPIIKKAFLTDDDKTQSMIAVNLSANLLGMGGVATTSGISATTMLTNSDNYEGACLLFILSATSIQLLPTTVISLRQTFNSVSPFDIFLPSIFTTVFSTLCGIFIYSLTRFFRRKK